MADVVNLQQSEYDTAIGALEGLHQQTITAITNLMVGINNLAAAEGGFYIEHMSEKTMALTDALSSGVIALLSDNMAMAKESMEDFAQIVTNIDSACSVSGT